jgi:hypothetical protein
MFNSKSLTKYLAASMTSSFIPYTGKILFVGDGYIHPNINTFGGCSGGVVFLLDVDQPSSVLKSDYGKAIAIHMVGHPTKPGNLAFVISTPPRSFCQGLCRSRQSCFVCCGAEYLA